MTEHELNTKIALALGWRHEDKIGCDFIPAKYTSCLNACAEMEEKGLVEGTNLTKGRVTYNNKLMWVCGSHAACVSAKPIQRCVAFGLLYNLINLEEAKKLL